MDTKNWLKSKTIWLSLITIAIGVLQFVQSNLEAGTAITLWGVISLILRMLTTQPIVKQE